ncbi:uncharacterized protein LOC141932305 [Strix aluco]|uniref:uncharacterized protein LOC141932305 n=1 Tax=Strix aluco TaxID=111821 RepID=UPI003DA2756C
MWPAFYELPLIRTEIHDRVKQHNHGSTDIVLIFICCTDSHGGTWPQIAGHDVIVSVRGFLDCDEDLFFERRCEQWHIPVLAWGDPEELFGPSFHSWEPHTSEDGMQLLLTRPGSPPAAEPSPAQPSPARGSHACSRAALPALPLGAGGPSARGSPRRMLRSAAADGRAGQVRAAAPAAPPQPRPREGAAGKLPPPRPAPSEGAKRRSVLLPPSPRRLRPPRGDPREEGASPGPCEGAAALG